MKNNLKNLQRDIMIEVLPEKRQPEGEEAEYWRGYQEGFNECFQKHEKKIEILKKELRERFKQARTSSRSLYLELFLVERDVLDEESFG